MELRNLRYALLGSAVACAFGGEASAQLLDVDATIARPVGTAPGRVQTFQVKPTYVPGSLPGFSGNFQPGQSYDFYSVTQNSTGRIGSLVVPAGGSPTNGLNTLGLSLYPAQEAVFYHESFHIGTVDDLVSILRDGKDTSGAKFDFAIRPYNDDCVRPAWETTPFNADANAVFGACDAVNFKIRMNGVDFNLSSPQNSTVITASIPQINYTYTTSGTRFRTERVDNLTGVTALSQLKDNFLTSGKEGELIRTLLGKPAGFTLPVGSLPTGRELMQVAVEFTPASGAKTTKTFGFDNFGEMVAYGLANRRAKPSDFGINYSDGCVRAATTVSGACDGISASLSVLGVEATVTAAPNSPDVTVAIPSIKYSFTSRNAADRNDAAAQFESDARQNVDFNKLAQTAARNLAIENGSDPLLGNPNSLQGQITRTSLDLDTPSASLGETSGNGSQKGGAGRDAQPSGWMVGGRVGHLSAATSEANYVDLNAEYSLRLREGSQGRLKFSTPLSVIRYSHGGGTVLTGAFRGSYEMPLIRGRWVLEPSAGIGGFYGSKDLLNSGVLYSLGLASRFKIAPVGRGHIVIGNAVVRSSTLEIHGQGFSTPKVTNTAFRNGIAYQLPIGERIFGRLGTLRTSYTFTKLTGAKAFLNEYHEVSLSYGLGSRDVAVRQRAEVLRIGLSGAFGRNYKSGALTLGYMF